MKNKFKRCYRCGGDFKIFYTNKKEEHLERIKTKQKDEEWKKISQSLKK